MGLEFQDSLITYEKRHKKIVRKFGNFNFSCNLKLLQIIITAQQLMVSPD